MKDRHHRESTLLKIDDKASKFHLKCLWFNNQAYQYSAKVKKKNSTENNTSYFWNMIIEI